MESCQPPVHLVFSYRIFCPCCKFVLLYASSFIEVFSFVPPPPPRPSSHPAFLPQEKEASLELKHPDHKLFAKEDETLNTVDVADQGAL